MQQDDPNKTIFDPSDLDRKKMMEFKFTRTVDSARRFYNGMNNAESRAEKLDANHLDYLGLDYWTSINDLHKTIIDDISKGDNGILNRFADLVDRLGDDQRFTIEPVIRKINDFASLQKGGPWQAAHPILEKLSVSSRSNNPLRDLADVAVASTAAWAAAHGGTNLIANGGVALSLAFDAGVRTGDFINEHIIGGTTWDDLEKRK